MKKSFFVFVALTLFLTVPFAAMAQVVSEPGITAYGPIDHYAPIGASDWGDPKEAVAAWVHGSWPSIPGATWISTSYYVEAPYNANSWRWFHDEFIASGIPCTAYDVTGVVKATSDNAEEVYVNGSFIGSDGEVQGAFVDNQEWNTVIDYEISLLPGTNTLDFIVRNYSGTNSQTGNPTALIYSVDVTGYELPYVEWQPPVTNANFVLKNGTTLPLKFKLYQQDETLIIEEKNVAVALYEGECCDECQLPDDEPLYKWELGPGVENLRFDSCEYYYIANVKTKDLELAGGQYCAVVLDECGETTEVLGCINFYVTSDKPANRGNSKK